MWSTGFLNHLIYTGYPINTATNFLEWERVSGQTFFTLHPVTRTNEAIAGKRLIESILI